MKGLLKIYHPEETLKYHIKSTYCKSVYSNSEHLLEIEIITDDSLDHVEDDSLQYKFPQISLDVFDFPIDKDDDELAGNTFKIAEGDEESYTEVDLFDDETATLHDNELEFKNDENGDLQLLWKGKITDFFTNSPESLPFKLKCDFREEEILVDE